MKQAVYHFLPQFYSITPTVRKRQRQGERRAYELLTLSQSGRTARKYCAESTPSVVVDVVVVVVASVVLAPCAADDDDVSDRLSDVGTTTVSRPGDRLCTKVLYSPPHLSMNSAEQQSNHK